MKKGLITRLVAFLDKRESDPRTEVEFPSDGNSVDDVKYRLEHTLDTAPVAYALTVNDVLVEVNEYARNHIGMEPGQNFKQFCEDAEQRNMLLSAAGQNKQTLVTVKTKNGEVRRFLGNMTIADYQQQEAHILWGIDIEESELKSDQLLYSRKSFRTVLDALPIPIRIVDLESHEIVYGNDSFWEMLEYNSPEERIGLKISDIMQETQGNGEASAEKINYIAETPGAYSIEIDYRTKTGRLIEALIAIRKIDHDGRPSSIGIITDLTAEKMRTRMLFNAAEKEKEGNKLKSKILMDMSHEVMTPMNGIIGMTDLLLGEKITRRQIEYVMDIKKSSEDLINIVNTVLDYAKISEGKMKILPVDIELGAFLRNIVYMTRFSARTKGLEFIEEINIKSPEYVRVDDIRLKQVLLNLLSNAVKFTKAGSVSFHVKIEADNVFFRVSDTGIGVKQEDIPLLFSAFGQVDESKNRGIKGTGLGLSISKQLIDMMDGKIWLESEYGVGSHFYVTVPYIPGDEASVKAAGTESENIYAPTANILLVDDIQSNLTVTSGLLRLCGITADIAMSGMEAIDLAREKDYDIIFMDYMMPVMDGAEAMKIIRSLGEKQAKWVIIALTAGSASETKDYLLSAGMDDFLSKPLGKGALINILKKWLPDSKVESVAGPDIAEQSTVYSELLQSVSLIEDVDIKLALSRLGGMQDVLEKSLTQVAKSIGEYLADMGRYLSEDNLKDFSVAIHGIKGALANIGAMRYSELAAELEILSKARNIPKCQERFAAFVDVMTDLSAKLNAILSQAVAKDLPQGDIALLKQKAEAAIELLKEYELSEARACLSGVFDFTYNGATDKLLNDIKDAIDAADYDGAIALLESVVL